MGAYPGVGACPRHYGNIMEKLSQYIKELQDEEELPKKPEDTLPPRSPNSQGKSLQQWK
jgi:hypothetical protein